MSKLEFDPYSHKVHEDPYPYYKALRENEPVYYNEERDLWILTKYEDVKMVMRDWKTFSNHESIALERAFKESFPYPMVTDMNPPEHTRLRKLVSSLMTPERLLAQETFIRKKTRELLEPFQSKGEIDIIADFGAYLPMAVIANMMDLPSEDEDKVRILTDQLLARDESGDSSESNAKAYGELVQYMDNFANESAKKEFSDDILTSHLVKAEQEGKMSHDEVIAFLMLLGIAGNETTTKMIGNMCLRLWQHKDQRQKLIDDPSLIESAVEEMLRFDGSSQIVCRTVMKDVEIRGKKIKANDRVAVCMIAANRDEDKYENAEQFDITRGARDHMAFGFGIHSCLGAALARLEIRVVFGELLQMMPDFELHIDSTTRAHSPSVRGFSSLPMTFTPLN